MAGRFTEVDPEQCAQHAQFMRNLSRRQADTIFWLLFSLTVILLICASQMHSKRLRIACLALSTCCFLLALPLVAFSALAGLTIEFCHGEDPIFFYWAFWTLIQVGSLIAILGVSVNQCYGLGHKEGPPWNVALGTPVLMLAGLGHGENVAGRAVWKRVSRRDLSKRLASSPEGGDGSLEMRMGTRGEVETDVDEERKRNERELRDVRPSRASTIINSPTTLSSQGLARHIGYTVDNEPIYTMDRTTPNTSCPTSPIPNSPSPSSVSLPPAAMSAGLSRQLGGRDGPGTRPHALRFASRDQISVETPAPIQRASYHMVDEGKERA